MTALALALMLPASAQTESSMGDQNGTLQNSQNMNTPPHGQREAMRMVPAQAAIDRTLDSDKTKPGDPFRAKLVQKVQLDNGPELPAGTMLIGTVATDDMNEGGTSKLALRFTQADLKDGQIVPIKATIVGIYGPDNTDSNGYFTEAGEQMPNSWNDGTLQVDQMGIMSGVDLHSRISSKNSGVLVSKKKDDLKVSSDSEFALAIAQQSHPMNGSMNGNTSN